MLYSRKEVLGLLRENGLYVTGNKQELNQRWQLFKDIKRKRIIPTDSFRQQIGQKGLKILLRNRKLPITGNKDILWSRLVQSATAPSPPKRVTRVMQPSFGKRYAQIRKQIPHHISPQEAAIFTILECYSTPNFKYIEELYQNYPKLSEEYIYYIDYYIQQFEHLLSALIYYDYYHDITPRECARRLAHILTILDISNVNFLMFENFAADYYQPAQAQNFLNHVSKYLLLF